MAIVVGAGYERSDITFGNGSVWLPNEAKGEVAHVSGPSAEVDFRVKVAKRDEQLTVVTGDRSVYVLNRTVGSLTRLDPRTASLDAFQEDVPSGGRTAVVTNGSGLYVLDPEAGVVLVLDAGSLEIEASLRVGRGEVRGAVTDDGELWVTSPSASELVRVSEGEVVERTPLVADPDHDVRVVVFDGDQVGVLDLTDGVWFPHQQDGAELPGAPGAIRVGRTTDDPAFSRDGRLITLDGANGAVKSETELAPGDEFGPPVTDDDRQFVANFSTGEMFVADVRSGELIHRVALVDRNGPILIDASDSFGFGVLPGTARAFVVSPDGEVKEVDLGSPSAILLDQAGEDITSESAGESDAESEGINEEFENAATLAPPPTVPEPPPGDDDEEPPPPVPCADGQNVEPNCLPQCSDGLFRSSCDLCEDGVAFAADGPCRPRCSDGQFRATCDLCPDGVAFVADGPCRQRCNDGNFRLSCALCSDGVTFTEDGACPERCADGVFRASCALCADGISFVEDGPCRQRCSDGVFRFSCELCPDGVGFVEDGQCRQQCSDGVFRFSCALCPDGVSFVEDGPCPTTNSLQAIRVSGPSIDRIQSYQSRRCRKRKP